MRPEDTPFKAGWLMSDLKGYRPCNRTYCLHAYDELPPIPVFTLNGDLSWLEPLNEHLKRRMAPYQDVYEDNEEDFTDSDQLIKSAEALELTLPQPFVKLIQSRELQLRVPSCTACYFTISSQPVPSPTGDDAYLIRFLNDQQSVCTWYLYLKPSGEHCVVISGYIAEDDELSDEERASIVDNTLFCAPSFEEFIYRFWIENMIWFVLVDKYKPLTEQQQRYLDHYKHLTDMKS